MLDNPITGILFAIIAGISVFNAIFLVAICRFIKSALKNDPPIHQEIPHSVHPKCSICGNTVARFETRDGESVCMNCVAEGK